MRPRLALAVLGCLPALAQMISSARADTAADTAARYKTPPRALAQLADRPPTPTVSVSPRRDQLAILERPAFLTIADLAQPELGLAGIRINPKTSGPSRSFYFTSVELVDVANGRRRKVAGLPASPRLGSPQWSPDGKQIAMTATADAGIALIVIDVATGRARAVTDHSLNATAGKPCAWLSDSRRLVCRTRPSGRGAPPVAETVPRGPIVQETAARKAPTPTFTYLLESERDEALFDHHFTSQLVLVDVVAAAARPKPIGKPGIIVDSTPSPDGAHILVVTVHRPYSYRVPIERFPRRVEVWNTAGKRVVQVADIPLKEEVPIDFDAVPTGPRSFAWRADADATLSWAEALDGGDPRRKVSRRDRVFVWAAPFRGKRTRLIDLEQRFAGITWGGERLALVSEQWWKTRHTRTWRLSPSSPATAPAVVWDRSYEDRYTDPGVPLTVSSGRGTWVLKTTADGDGLFLFGDGASDQGDRPFVDRMSLSTGKAERLWQSAPPRFEEPLDLLGDDGTQILIRREANDEPPNIHAIDIAGKKSRALTEFPHPYPELKGMKVELIRYKRADGVMLTAKLITPPGWTPRRGRLPVLMWAYPTEFKSASAAGQVTDSPHRFQRLSPSSPLLFLARGWAILDDPTMPIVGEGTVEPNDTYVEQLSASAKAAVDEVVRRGVADRDKIAIGGHSYGAFMTANLLAHTNLFRAGIARSGAYNRTLTPFGFQSEERSLWEARDTYVTMSPFLNAQKIDEPLLLIHGTDDNNTGTFPIQSERLYESLAGLGGTARLVLLPKESHGYQARESIMHMLWETDRWLTRHVRTSRRDEARARPSGRGR